MFDRVVRTVMPVAEQMCRERTRQVSCRYKIEVDSRKSEKPNAFQSLDRSRRPVIVFTASLIESARNEHELAFVLGHEAAHHIKGHVPLSSDAAMAGALLAGASAAISGAKAEDIKTAQDAGALAGYLVYSKDFEFAADGLGAEIAFRAGYDPLWGARFFSTSGPANRFLSTHPPNAQRLAAVRKVVATLK